MIFAVLGWVLFVLMVFVYVGFSRHMARRVEGLSEYIEFVFQNRIVYEDHRNKYISMLREVRSGAPQMTLRDLANHSKRAVDDMAAKLHKQACLTNAIGRGSVDGWATADSAANLAAP